MISKATLFPLVGLTPGKSYDIETIMWTRFSEVVSQQCRLFGGA